MHFSSQEELERNYWRFLLAGESRTLRSIWSSIANFEPIHREYTGVGFYTSYARHPESDFSFRGGDVNLFSRGEPIATFVVFVDHAKPVVLEGVTYEGDWPATFDGIELRYADPNRRWLSSEEFG